MLIGGVVFRYFAGLTYWFERFFGFKLHEGLGKAAALAWILGFVVAFTPLYALGLMGVTRRLDHYDANPGWQALFIVAAIGFVIILAGVFIAAHAARRRNLTQRIAGWRRPMERLHSEWSDCHRQRQATISHRCRSSPRDPFWELKESGKKPKPIYEDF